MSKKVLNLINTVSYIGCFLFYRKNVKKNVYIKLCFIIFLVWQLEMFLALSTFIDSNIYKIWISNECYTFRSTDHRQVCEV